MTSPPSEIDLETGLPIGPVVPTDPSPSPVAVRIEGTRVDLAPLGPEHDAALFAAASGEGALASYRYLADRPPTSVDDVRAWRETADHGGTRVGWAIVDRASGEALGYQFLMRIQPAFRSIEIGNVRFGPRLRRTPGATEAVHLLARHVFEDLGYRRFEWKCDALNAPSRRAAERFGFRYEGTFRRDMILNGRSRDTAWYSMIDEEWPATRATFEAWLAPSNFDENGEQRRPLASFRD